MKKPIKILQVTIGNGNYGGIAAFLYTFYEHMDHKLVHYDFLYCGENSLKSKIESATLKGSKITTLNLLKENNNGLFEYLNLYHRLKAFFSKNSYDIVHINTSNVFVNYCVERAVGKKTVCISHSHNTKSPIEYSGKWKSTIKEQLRKPCRRYVLKHSRYLFACSEAAGKYLFGSHVIDNPKFQIIHNAIQVKDFTYDVERRTKIRNTENQVFGFVGRLSDQKNPIYMIDIFDEIHKLNDRTELWLVGDGELKGKLIEKVDALGIGDSVKFMGARNDVPDLMQAMDALLLPSLYEGLAIVAVEAQAAGLYVFASDSISAEHKITNKLFFFSLKDSPKQWAKNICDQIDIGCFRKDTQLEMVKAGYDIESAAKNLEKIYVGLVNSETSPA